MEELMKTISVFNNKGGVGKTTLTYHLACALAELGHRTLIIDLDPQCNMTVLCMDQEKLHEIWAGEDPFIEDYKSAKDQISSADFEAIVTANRSIHFLLKPVEDGVSETLMSAPYAVAPNLDLIPGRLSLHLFEDKIASRWSEVYQGDPLAIRTVTNVREISERYAKQHKYDFVIIDTSPSLGALNKVIISTTDCFIVPCMPDMFSLYGIRNIGNSLSIWKKQFDTIFHFLSDEKRKNFPNKFVRFIGYTIYNARKYSGGLNDWDLARAQFNYAKQIPDTIRSFMKIEIREHLPDDLLEKPIGGTSVMHSHATMANMAQKYRVPIWKVPEITNLESSDVSTISGNSARYKETRAHYLKFAKDTLLRIATLEG